MKKKIKKIKPDYANVFRACIFGNQRECKVAIDTTMRKLEANKCAYFGFDHKDTVWYLADCDGKMVMRYDTFLTPDDLHKVIGKQFHEIATGGTYFEHDKWFKFEEEMSARIYPRT